MPWKMRKDLKLEPGASQDNILDGEKTPNRLSHGCRKEPVLVIHGGAGTMSKEGSTPEMREKYKNALRSALRAGHAVLENGGEAMDAAVAAVVYMEDCPLFNAGKGAVFNVEGKNELETSLMLSKPPATHPNIAKSRRGMTLTLITHLKNPSKAVRAIYLSPESAPHASLSGSAAESIAASLGQETVEPSYYFTERRWREHRRGLGLPELPLPSPNNAHEAVGADEAPLDLMPTGTVGAVCLDSRGCIASVTSTGGKTNKLVGRIGDTPTFAAGFWAEEWEEHGWRRYWRKLTNTGVKRSVGISGTGDGDYFLRLATASTVAHRMKFRSESIGKAAKAAVEELRRNGGIGGIIAVDGDGNVAMPLNCSGMYRGQWIAGVPRVAIFDDDPLE